MRKITQEEYDSLPVKDGMRFCPGHTDYSLIRNFGNRATFGDWATFGEGARFGDWARFGNWATFGDWATFGNWARFEEAATFGEGAAFGEVAAFGERARFGNRARFENLPHISKPGNPLIQFDRFGSGNRITQFFNTEGGVFVRCGCQFLSLDKFRDRVESAYGQIGHGLIYLGIANIAEEYFRQQDEKHASGKAMS